jgi:hypothetical protein
MSGSDGAIGYEIVLAGVVPVKVDRLSFFREEHIGNWAFGVWPRRVLIRERGLKTVLGAAKGDVFSMS